MFEEDDETEAVVMIGEIGGDAEEKAAAYIKEHVTKPVVSFIAGITAPTWPSDGSCRCDHYGGKGTAAEKMATLEPPVFASFETRRKSVKPSKWP